MQDNLRSRFICRTVFIHCTAMNLSTFWGNSYLKLNVALLVQLPLNFLLILASWALVPNFTPTGTISSCHFQDNFDCFQDSIYNRFCSTPKSSSLRLIQIICDLISCSVYHTIGSWTNSAKQIYNFSKINPPLAVACRTCTKLYILLLPLYNRTL